MDRKTILGQFYGKIFKMFGYSGAKGFENGFLAGPYFKIGRKECVLPQALKSAIFGGGKITPGHV